MIVIAAGPTCTLSACTWGELAKEYTSQAFFAGLITLAAVAIVITMLTKARRRGRR